MPVTNKQAQSKVHMYIDGFLYNHANFSTEKLMFVCVCVELYLRERGTRTPKAVGYGSRLRKLRWLRQIMNEDF